MFTIYTYQILFTGGDNAEFEAWDISSPSNPIPIVQSNPITPYTYEQARVINIAIYNGYIIIGYSTGLIEIHSVSNPGQVTGSLYLSYEISDIYVEGSRLYIQGADRNVYIYSLSDVNNPSFLTSFSDYGRLVIVEDTLLYSAQGGMWGGGFKIFNIADINNPVQVGEGNSILTEIWRIRKYGDNLYLCGSFLEAWDVSNPSNINGRSWAFGLSDVSGINDISMFDNTYITASGIGGLSVINFDTLGNPYEANSFRTPGWTAGLTHANNLTYHLSLTNNSTITLFILDSSGYIGKARMNTGGHYCRSSKFLNNRLYFVNDTALAYFDVTDPYNPHRGEILYIAVPNSIYRDFLLNDNYAYVTSDSGIYVIELSTMRQVGVVQDTRLWTSSALAAAGDYLYLADGYKIGVFDISNPASPTLLSVTTISEAYARFRSIAIYGNYMYASTEVNQIVIMDLNDPAHPAYLSAYFPQDRRGYGLYDLQIQGNYLFETSGSSRSVITAFNISNPISPLIAGYNDNYYDLSGRWAFFSVEGNTVYLADYTIGVHVLNFNPTVISESPVFAAISPGYTSINRIEFSLPRTGLVNITIFDVSGRVLIRNKTIYIAGKHVMEVSNLRNGVYHYIIETNNFALKGRMLVMK